MEHRLDIITRRTEYRLRKARERSHIVEGLLEALDNIDLVIVIIRGAADVPDARVGLITQLGLSEIQANHILDMQLRRLTALEVDKLRTELEELKTAISGCERLLGSEQRKRTLLDKELTQVANTFGGPRRTTIMSAEDIVVIEDASVEPAATTIADSDTAVIVTLSTSGLLGRISAEEEFSAKQGRHDVVSHLVHTTSHAMDICDHRPRPAVIGASAGDSRDGQGKPGCVSDGDVLAQPRRTRGGAQRGAGHIDGTHHPLRSCKETGPGHHHLDP